jgi:hypothetical protein
LPVALLSHVDLIYTFLPRNGFFRTYISLELMLPNSRRFPQLTIGLVSLLSVALALPWDGAAPTPSSFDEYDPFGQSPKPTAAPQFGLIRRDDGSFGSIQGYVDGKRGWLLLLLLEIIYFACP